MMVITHDEIHLLTLATQGTTGDDSLHFNLSTNVDFP